MIALLLVGGSRGILVSFLPSTSGPLVQSGPVRMKTFERVLNLMISPSRGIAILGVHDPGIFFRL